MQQRLIPRWAFNSMLACWVSAVALGFLILDAYGVLPGVRGETAGRWPSETSLRLAESRPNLLIFLHPRCPCSRASLDELAWVLTRCRGRISAKAIVFRPDRADEEWSRARSEIKQELTGFPDLSFRDDPGGVEARRFGITTSGHVLLFDASGRRIFDGGITPSRGQRGENRGREEVVARILDPGRARELANPPATPVFGCPIITPLALQDKGS